MTMNLVSVIIPCYNCENLVLRAVDSVLSQSYQNIEIILVENNSTDGTYTVLKKLEQQYPDKITVYSEPKKGACAARNHGLKKAKGKWVQFLDADDELLPQKIESQLVIINETNPDIIVEDYHRIRTVGGRIIREDIVSEEDLWLGLINSRLGITSSNLWRKETLLEVDGWNEELTSSQEYDMLFRLLKLKPKVAISHKISTIIYAQQDSLSRTLDNNKMYRLYLNRYNLRCQILKFMKEQSLLNKKYEHELSVYIYFHLLLIRELNVSYFNEQVRRFDFQCLSPKDRISILTRFIRNSVKRKYAFSNVVFKTLEWKLFFLKNLSHLRF